MLSGPYAAFAVLSSETAAVQPSDAVGKEAGRRMQWGEAGNPIVALLQQQTLQTQTVSQIESTMAPEATVRKGPPPKGQAWEIPQKDVKVPQPTSEGNMAQTRVVEKKGDSPRKAPSDAVAQMEEDKSPALGHTHIVTKENKDKEKEKVEGSPSKKNLDGKPITSEEAPKVDSAPPQSGTAGESSSTEGFKKVPSSVSVKTVVDKLQDVSNAEEKAVDQQPLRDEGVAGKESGAGQEAGAVVEDDLEIQEYEAMLEEEEKEEVAGEGEPQEEEVAGQEVPQEEEKEVDDS